MSKSKLKKKPCIRKNFIDSSSKLEGNAIDAFANRIKTAQTKIQGEEERERSY